jgi:hypothetical protein
MAADTLKARKTLLRVAAEMVRGPNLDERFELDERLPRWVHNSVARLCDRQRKLGCDVRDSMDAMQARIAQLERAGGWAARWKRAAHARWAVDIQLEAARAANVSLQADLNAAREEVERLRTALARIKGETLMTVARQIASAALKKETPP